MKRNLLLVILSLLAAPIVALSQELASNAIPADAIQIELTVKKEVIKSGPYARYAQQYLGVTATLVDKTNYEISDAKVVKINNISDNNKNISSNSGNIEFTDLGLEPIVTSINSLTANRNSVREKSLSDMASDAAEAIFTLRKRRFDLITGETQDAFGAGLGAAIKEMKRVESDYTDLFLGKKSVSYEKFMFTILPNNNKANYVLCRFSETAGVMDILQSEGGQIVLSLNPENSIKPIVLDAKMLAKGAAMPTPQLVPDWVTATLTFNTNIIATAMLELYQFGKVVLPTIKEK